MIICICEGVNDKTIAKEIERGAPSVQAIKRRCGAGGGCGQCVADLKQMLRTTDDDAPHIQCVPAEAMLAS